MRKRIKTIGCLILVLMIIYAQQAMPSYAGDKAVGKITIRREGEAIGSNRSRRQSRRRNQRRNQCQNQRRNQSRNQSRHHRSRLSNLKKNVQSRMVKMVIM